MKKALMVVVAGLIWLGLGSAESVSFAMGEWEPYTGRELEGYGMAAEIVTAACRAGGLTAEYVFFPWKRAESNVESGAYFATFPYQGTKERSANYAFSEPLCISSNGILLHKGNPRTAGFTYARIEDLKGLRVGLLAGSDALKLPLLKAGVSVAEVQKVDQNIRKLEAGRLDCVIEDFPVIVHALRKTLGSDAARLEQFYFTERGFGNTVAYRLLVSRKYPRAEELLERFNEGLRKIKADGEYQKILKKYGM